MFTDSIPLSTFNSLEIIYNNTEAYLVLKRPSLSGSSLPFDEAAGERERKLRPLDGCGGSRGISQNQPDQSRVDLVNIFLEIP